MHASDPRQPSTWPLAESHPADRAKPSCHLGACPHASNGATARLPATNLRRLIAHSGTPGPRVPPAHVQLQCCTCCPCLSTCLVKFVIITRKFHNTYPSVSCCDAAVIRPVKPQDLVFSPRSQWRRSTPLGFSECNYSSRHIPLDDTNRPQTFVSQRAILRNDSTSVSHIQIESAELMQISAALDGAFARPGFRVALRIFGHWLLVAMILTVEAEHLPSHPSSRSTPIEQSPKPSTIDFVLRCFESMHGLTSGASCMSKELTSATDVDGMQTFPRLCMCSVPCCAVL